MVEKIHKMAPIVIGLLVLVLAYQYFSDYSYKQGFTGEVIIDPSCTLDAYVNLGLAEAIIRDGDAYFGEDLSNPNWVWSIGNLNMNNLGTNLIDPASDPLGPWIGVESDIVRTSFVDGPLGVGECINNLPNNPNNYYVNICFDSINNPGYLDVTTEFLNNVDTAISGHPNGLTNAKTIHLSAPRDVFVLDSDSWTIVNDLKNVDNRLVSDIWIQLGVDVSDGVGTGNIYPAAAMIFFRDAGKIAYGGLIDTHSRDPSLVGYANHNLTLLNSQSALVVGKDNKIYFATEESTTGYTIRKYDFVGSPPAAPFAGFVYNPSLGPAGDFGKDLEVNGSNIVFTGAQDGEDTVRVEMITPSGMQLWQFTNDPTPGVKDVGKAIGVDSRGIIYVGADRNDNSDLAIYKLHSSGGQELWVGPRVWDPSVGTDEINALVVDNNNDFYIGGSQNNGNEFFIQKFNEFGNPLNLFSQDKSVGNETVIDMVVDSNNNIYAAMEYNDKNIARIVRLNSSLQLDWEYYYDPNPAVGVTDFPGAINVGRDGNIYVAITERNNAIIRLLVLDSNGNYLWDYSQSIIAGTIRAEGVDIDGGGNIYIGATQNPGALGALAMVIALKPIWSYGGLGVDVSKTYTIAGYKKDNTQENNLKIGYITPDPFVPLGVHSMHKINFEFTGDSLLELNKGEDFIDIGFGVMETSYEYNSLGGTKNLPEEYELSWVNSGIGRKSGDHRGLYGEVINNINMNSYSDKVILGIPNDQVQATISIDGVAEDIPLGRQISENEIYTFPALLTSFDIPTLLGVTPIAFGGVQYNAREMFVPRNFVGTFPSIETSLSSADDNYQANVYMEMDTSSFRYYYSFDDPIDIVSATRVNPLVIDFFGAPLNIMRVTSATSFKVDNITFNPPGAFTVVVLNDITDTVSEGTSIATLMRITPNSIDVDVDGVTQTLNSGVRQNVNGVIVDVNSINCFGATGAVCGDGTCNSGETCASCSGDCGVCFGTCGDGVVNAGEGCDDRNTLSGDGCSTTCSVESSGGPGIEPVSSGSSSSRFSKTFSRIDAGEQIIERISKQNIPMTELKFETKRDFFNVDLDVKKHNKLPGGITKPPVSDQDVYGYVEIEFEDMAKSDFESSEVQLKVSSSWVNNRGNNNEDKLKLMKYDNGNWKVMKTILDFRDSSNLYYDAETKGFSHFAIVLSDEQPRDQPQAICGNSVIDLEETCANCPRDFVCRSGQVCQSGICTVIQREEPTRLPPPPVSNPPVEEQPSFFNELKDIGVYIGILVGIIVLVIIIFLMVRYSRRTITFSRTDTTSRDNLDKIKKNKK